MKTNMMMWMAMVVTLSAMGQDTETVFGNGGPRIRGAYGAATYKVSSVDGQAAYLLGGYGGVLLERNLLLGAGAYTVLNGRSLNIESDGNTARQMTYIGLVLEKTYRSQKAFHWGAQILTGGAVLGEQSRLENGGQYTLSTRGAFAVEPGIQAEVNFTHWFRMAAGASYRWVVGEQAYSAPAAHISLKFGKF